MLKAKEKKARYTPLNAEFQRIAGRDKKPLLSNQCKEIEENNRMGKSRDLFKNIRDTKGSSAGKESTCNAGDPGSVPGLGSAGEGIGYLLKYSWASFVAQLVKNLPAMWKT